jgi:hypothetical protein
MGKSTMQMLIASRAWVGLEPFNLSTVVAPADPHITHVRQA